MNQDRDQDALSTTPAGQTPEECDCRSYVSRLPRRRFLKLAGASMIAGPFAGGLFPMAGPFGAADVTSNHLVPADKKLSEAWIRALFERGTKEVFRGKSLDNIGMPCGGIATGQLYLCGDGTLGCWQIFNNAVSNWVGSTNSTYEHRGIPRPVDQGFAVAVKAGAEWVWKPLCKEGFSDVEFQGEYPIGNVRYAEVGFPAAVRLEAFSPFIPLNAKDSTLPATVFHITVKNTSGAPVRVKTSGWLQNAAALYSAAQFGAIRRSQVLSEDAFRTVLHMIAPTPEYTQSDKIKREPILFADFEGKDYAPWSVEGEAMGSAPATGTLPDQQEVTGFEGKGLVNSFVGGDDPKGRLTSPVFTIERRFINFLIGGGMGSDVSMNLEIGGETVRTASGFNNEQLKWQSWTVADLEGKQARLVIVDEKSGGWGHINVDQIEFSDTRHDDGPQTVEEASDYGTMALACLGATEVPAAPYPGKPADQYVFDGDISFDAQAVRLGYVQAAEVALAPGAEAVFSFAIAWHFPNQENGHEYAARFADALAVLRYVQEHQSRLTADTRLWRDTFYDSTLPYWLLDRLHSTVSILASGTCQYWKNGRFWAWEGVNCCEGTCTHVWNYSHAEARLFPELARSTREMQDFCPRDQGGGFHPDTGLVGFRSNDNYAADGQCGTILKAYREHLMSPDDAFLKRNWPSIRKALEYSIEQDAKGPSGDAVGNADGLIENTQHNTYDINYEGPNTFVGSLYLAALRAGEEMARLAGDTGFADKARAIFESGRKLTHERLYDGEYYIQDVDLEKFPKYQYKNGCLSDQLFGQGWAWQLSLGNIYSPESIRSALQAVWKYNWAPDIGPYNEAFPPFRWFISPGQAGLLICTWPKSEYLTEGTLYREEVWTGIEYQVAGHMIWEGMLTEGLAICRAVHERYHPDLFNPYNEIECGDHYARAMASWGVYLALAGFEYDGPKAALAFAPRMKPDNFKAAFTWAQGWGTFAQERTAATHKASITLRWGTLPVASLKLATADGFKPKHIRALVDGKVLDAGMDIAAGAITVHIREKAVLQPGSVLEVVADA